MSSLRTLGLVALTAAAALAVSVAPAAAEFGPIQLISKTVPQQAKEAKAPVLSADGRYLAFEGILDGGQMGVFRDELRTGLIERVATGLAIGGGVTATANAPSISADGRYVSFTTKQPLDPSVDPEPSSEDVYVADMSTSPPTYTLVSAENGSGEAMSTPSRVAPRGSISGDGSEVAFVSGVEGQGEGPQVYVRDLATATTTLVSVARDPISGTMEPGTPAPEGAAFEQAGFIGGASISADGTTVAWLGGHVAGQVPLLSDEKAAIEGDDRGATPYNEPLWRRIADGPYAPTRRIVGGGDPLAPGCPADGTLADPVCQGPFPDIDAPVEFLDSASGWLGVAKLNGVPQLSADGLTVLLIGNPDEASNLFLVDMAAGLSRDQAVTRLTEQVSVKPGEEALRINVEPYVPLNGWIYDAAISSNGKQIAFDTSRQKFPHAPPNLVTPQTSALGLDELYTIDLENEALRRVTHGYESISEPSLATENLTRTPLGEDGASSPSFGADGGLVTFASGASNLVRGDGNESKDVFVVEDTAVAGGVGGGGSTSPVTIKVKPRRRLTLSGFSLPNGKVKLVATAPAVGKLRAQAAATLKVGKGPRRVAAKAARAKAGKPVGLILALPNRLRGLAHSAEGLYATVKVNFKPRRGGTMRGKLQVHFHAHQAKSKAGHK